MLGVNCWGMTMTVEKISAVTFRVLNMTASVRFYKDVLGMEIVFGGEDAFFSSLRAKGGNAPLLNLERGHSEFNVRPFHSCLLHGSKSIKPTRCLYHL